jgi:hypothetical protein
MAITKAKQRIVTFDLIRGFFILVIIIDHLERWPGIFDWMTGQGRLWVSAAEGFILMSGVMIGLIRGRKDLHLPFKTVTKKIIKRSATLYVWAIITAVISLWVVKVWGATLVPYPPGTDSFSPNYPDIVEIMTMTATFGWSVFLQFYAVFLLFSPIAIWLLRKNRWKMLLMLSVAIWLIGLNFKSIFLSWQLLFFIGVVFGFYYDAIVAWWRGFRYQKAAVVTIFSVTALTVVMSVLVIFGWSLVKSGHAPVSYEQFLSFRDRIDPYFLRQKLLPWHLAMALTWFAALFLLFRRFEKPIAKYMGWLLIPFGQNSLYVYITQGFVVIAVSGLVSQTASMFVNALIIMGTVLIVWGITFIKPLYKIIPR